MTLSKQDFDSRRTEGATGIKMQIDNGNYRIIFPLSKKITIMKKIKLFMFVALFGAMSFGAFSAYDYVTMSADEKAFLENIEALTSGESGGGSGSGEVCYNSIERTDFGSINQCINSTGKTDCYHRPGYSRVGLNSRPCDNVYKY